jgi:hypothetical protein
MRNFVLLSILTLASSASVFAQHPPLVVASLVLHGQTAALPPTTVYTPHDSGMFRASTIMVLTTANGLMNQNWAPVLQSTFDGLSILAAPCTTDLNTQLVGNSVGGIAPVADDAGMPITISVIPLGNVAGSAYDLFVVIERL